MAGRVDSGMPVKESSELIAARAVELLLSRPNGSRNYDNASVGQEELLLER